MSEIRNGSRIIFVERDATARHDNEQVRLFFGRSADGLTCASVYLSDDEARQLADAHPRNELAAPEVPR